MMAKYKVRVERTQSFEHFVTVEAEDAHGAIRAARESVERGECEDDLATPYDTEHHYEITEVKS